MRMVILLAVQTQSVALCIRVRHWAESPSSDSVLADDHHRPVGPALQGAQDPGAHQAVVDRVHPYVDVPTWRGDPEAEYKITKVRIEGNQYTLRSPCQFEHPAVVQAWRQRGDRGYVMPSR